MAGLAAEQSDEEIAEETVEGEDVLVIDPETWRKVAPEQVGLLLAAERFGLVGARAWMRSRGHPWTEVVMAGGT